MSDKPNCFATADPSDSACKSCALLGECVTATPAAKTVAETPTPATETPATETEIDAVMAELQGLEAAAAAVTEATAEATAEVAKEIAKPKAKAKAKAEPKPKAGPKAKAEPKAEPKAKPKAGPKAEAASEFSLPSGTKITSNPGTTWLTKTMPTGLVETYKSGVYRLPQVASVFESSPVKSPFKTGSKFDFVFGMLLGGEEITTAQAVQALQAADPDAKLSTLNTVASDILNGAVFFEIAKVTKVEGRQRFFQIAI